MSALPRALVFKERTESVDAAAGYMRSMDNFREELREQAIQELQANPEYGEVQKYIDAIEGRHWRSDRPRYRSGFLDNLIADTRNNTLTELTDIRSVVEVTQSYGGLWEQQARNCTNIIRDQWLRYDMDLDLVDVVDFALFSAGYWKIDSKPPGRLIVTPAGMDSVLPINGARDLQMASAILYRMMSPVAALKMQFPARSEGLEREAWIGPEATIDSRFVRPGTIPEFAWRQFNPIMKRFVGHRAMPGTTAGSALNAQRAFPSVPKEEYWVEDHSVNESSSTVMVKHPDLPAGRHNYHYMVKPGERLFPRKRLFVYGGNRLLYDGPTPYWHNFHPFAKLVLNPVTWAPGGLSKYRNVLPFNRVINEIGAGVDDMTRRALNQHLIGRKGSVDPTAWDKFNSDEPGKKLLLNINGNPNVDVRYAGVPEIPGWVFQMLAQYYMPRAERHGGWMDPTRLAQKGQVPGGDTIEAMKDMMPGHARLEQRYIDAFLRDSGQQCISHVFQNFTEERRLQLLGPDGVTWEDFDFEPGTMVPAGEHREAFWKRFGVRVSSGSTHGSANDRKKLMAITLAQNRLISRQELLRVLDWGNTERIAKELQEEAEAMPDISGRSPRMSRGQRNGEPV